MMADDLTDGHWEVRGATRVWVGAPARRVRAPAKCGTDGGYYRHLRITKTLACDACLRAHADAERSRRARARGAAA